MIRTKLLRGSGFFYCLTSPVGQRRESWLPKEKSAGVKATGDFYIGGENGTD